MSFNSTFNSIWFKVKQTFKKSFETGKVLQIPFNQVVCKAFVYRGITIKPRDKGVRRDRFLLFYSFLPSSSIKSS